MTDPKAFQELENTLGGAASEALVDIIDSYLKNAPKMIKAIGTAVLCGDAASLQQAAHTLKSSSAVLSATSLSQICEELQKITRSGTVIGETGKVS